MRKPALTIGILLLAVILLAVVKIFVSNRILTSGSALSQVQDKLNAVKVENTLLSEKLYSMSSLTNIYSEADKLGFVEAGISFVPGNTLPIAIKQ
jgi:cell division protein FtsL